MSNKVVVKLALEGAQVVSGELHQVEGRLDTIGDAAVASSASTDRLSSALGRVAHYGLTGGALYGTVQAAMAVGSALFEASASAQRLVTQLNFATRGNSAQEMAFLSGVANKLGLELSSAAQAYAGFASAARGTALEGSKTRDVFEAMAKASAVMGLSADQTQGALLAVQQMMSKGVVSAEEFRGQLGERMPIALEAGAKALGVTTAEFSKMMETGQIVAEDFLPKFATAITEMLGNSVTEAANRLDAATARMGNAWEKLKRTVGDAGVSQAVANEASGMTNYLDGLSDAMDNAKKSGAGLVSTLSSGLGYVIARAPFDVLAGGSNLLNGTINMLTGNVFKLNTGLNLLPDVLKTNEQRTAMLEGKLKDASTQFAAMQARLAVVPDNIYLKSELFTLAQYIAKLKEAKAQKASLEGSANDTMEGVRASGMARERYMQEQVKNKEALAALRNKISGVPDGYAKEMAEIIRLNQAGVLVGKEYNDVLAQQQATLLKKTGGASRGASGVDDAARDLKVYNEEILKSAGLNANFAERWESLSQTYKRGSISVTQLTLAQAELLKEQKFSKAVAKDWTEQAQVSIKAVEDSVAAYDKQVDSLKKSADSVAQHVQKMQDEEKALLIAADLHISLAEAIEHVTVARLEEMQAAAYKDGQQEAGDAIKQEIKNRRDLMGLIGSKEARDANTKATKEAAEEWKKTTDSINTTLTDALMRGFESGKDFAGNMRDTIVNMFKTMVLRPVISAIMNPISQGVTGMLGLSGGASAGQGASSSLSTVQTLKGIYDTMAGGFSGISTSVSAGFNTLATSNFGASMGMSTSVGGGVGNAMTPAMAQFGSTLGVAAGYAGGIAAGKLIGTAISGGFQVGNSGSAIVNVGTIIGAIVGGPIGGAIGGAIGGVVNRAFGMGATETRAQGIEGSFSSAGFAGNNFANQHQDGGWFRGDKDWKETSALSAATTKQFTQGYAAIQSASMGAATSLGLSAAAIANYSEAISIQLSSDAAANEKAITKVFTDLGDHMATAVAPGLDALAKEGESASTTLSRLSTSITTANAWLSMLRQRLFQVGLAGGDAASKLADAFGGLANLTAASKSFYETYYTEGERSTQSQQDMAKALALVNLTLPATKAGLRDLAATLDLNTDAGRSAYAVLLSIAPEFAATADAIAKLATDAAASLMTAFTGGGKLQPALDAAKLKVDSLTASTRTMTGAVSYINAIMGDASSAVLSFGTGTVALDGGLTSSQASAALLSSQIAALKLNADSARINMTGLSAALDNVNTETFVTTIGLVFSNLATRIKSVISDIGTERTAVANAALQIVNPTVLSKAEINRAIASIGTAMPSNAGVVNANTNLAYADKWQSNLQAQGASSAAWYATQIAAAKGSYNTVLAGAKSDIASLYTLANSYGVHVNQVRDGNTNAPNNAYAVGANERLAGYGQISWSGGSPNIAAFNTAASTLVSKLTGVNGQLDSLASNAVNLQEGAGYAAAAWDKAIANATTTKVGAEAAAKAATVAYAAALQTFAIDAGKSVTKLSKLREETVKYYDAQKQLATLMGTSAAGLRGTVANYIYSQKSAAQQLNDLQGQFSKAYDMARVTDGETMAGYGDKLNSLLTPLIEKLGETGNSNLIASYLAQADSVAALIEAAAPVNYQQDSLAMLGSIDATLAALDSSAQSAEKIISNAVNAGSDKTAAGLRAVIAALTGKAVPAFASGGNHLGGLRLVGENGPELEATGPSRIYNASQTRSLLSGGGDNSDMVAELRALRQEVSDLRAEARATASNTSKLSRLFDRLAPAGDALSTRAVV